MHEVVLHLFSFIEWYQQRLEPASACVQHTGSKNSEVSELLGAHVDYYVLVDHYEMQLKTKCDDTVEKLIAENFPLLSTGLAGSALHGLIQLGYGYAAKNSRYLPNSLSLEYSLLVKVPTMIVECFIFCPFLFFFMPLPPLKNGVGWAPVSRGEDTPNFGHAFSSLTHFQTCCKFLLSSFQ